MVLTAPGIVNVEMIMKEVKEDGELQKYRGIKEGAKWEAEL